VAALIVDPTEFVQFASATPSEQHDYALADRFERSSNPEAGLMLFIVQLTDRPGSLALRLQLLSAHLEWLEQNQASVRVAGSLRHDPDAAPVGGCWIVDAARKANVEALVRRDPFWIGGLRVSCQVFHWSKAFPERLTAL
jgi:hypothetical protein